MGREHGAPATLRFHSVAILLRIVLQEGERRAAQADERAGDQEPHAGGQPAAARGRLQAEGGRHRGGLCLSFCALMFGGLAGRSTCSSARPTSSIRLTPLRCAVVELQHISHDCPLAAGPEQGAPDPRCHSPGGFNFSSHCALSALQLDLGKARQAAEAERAARQDAAAAVSRSCRTFTLGRQTARCACCACWHPPLVRLPPQR